jgi:predicted HTH domain antitoxin
VSDQKIIELFDSSNITLKELAEISGRSVAELKKLLMEA